mmetsp:Transcript_4138/g.10459  ORF Transcript_4138/g.10459 Transcript_4138/m.10459 type:complete len:328 (+) Transcript_4138:968-1951(+)
MHDDGTRCGLGRHRGRAERQRGSPRRVCRAGLRRGPRPSGRRQLSRRELQRSRDDGSGDGPADHATALGLRRPRPALPVLAASGGRPQSPRSTERHRVRCQQEPCRGAAGARAVAVAATARRPSDRRHNVLTDGDAAAVQRSSARRAAVRQPERRRRLPGGARPRADCARWGCHPVARRAVAALQRHVHDRDVCAASDAPTPHRAGSHRGPRHRARRWRRRGRVAAARRLLRARRPRGRTARRRCHRVGVRQRRPGRRDRMPVDVEAAAPISVTVQRTSPPPIFLPTNLSVGEGAMRAPPTRCYWLAPELISTPARTPLSFFLARSK